MGVQLHGLTHDVGGFGAVAVQQAHLVHGVQQLAVGRLEAVNLRDRAGHNNAHRVRHVVLAQRVRDALIDRGMFFICSPLQDFLCTFCAAQILAERQIRQCDRNRQSACKRQRKHLPQVQIDNRCLPYRPRVPQAQHQRMCQIQSERMPRNKLQRLRNLRQPAEQRPQHRRKHP